jgi:hypothetical protein
VGFLGGCVLLEIRRGVWGASLSLASLDYMVRQPIGSGEAITMERAGFSVRTAIQDVKEDDYGGAYLGLS